jgi:prepilin-type N-terminal cleavage/methylation domain-containing protein
MKSKGFTLIELMIVISLIAVLSTIVIAAVNLSRQKAKTSAIKGAMMQLLTQGQIYLGDYPAYAPAATTSRPGCYASSTFLTDNFFFAEIPSLMVANIDENGAPIACAVSANGNSFSIVANIGDQKNLCVDSDSNRIESEIIDNTNGRCLVPPPAAPQAPVYINNGGTLTPNSLTIQSGTTVNFSYSGQNGSRTMDCTPGGPSFTIGASNPLYSYQFNGVGTTECRRQGNPALRGTINVTP